MVEIKKISLEDKDKSDLEFLEKLYIDSFPPNERRSLLKMTELIEANSKFNVTVLIDSQKDDQRMGFLNYWVFDTFIFLEHFAINAEYRNGGYGQKALKEFFKITKLPLVGEIELPSSSDFAYRRSKFYERIGFKIWDIPYGQPSFTVVGDIIPMKLITYRNIDLDNVGKLTVNQIYKEIYLK